MWVEVDVTINKTVLVEVDTNCKEVAIEEAADVIIADSSGENLTLVSSIVESNKLDKAKRHADDTYPLT